MKKFDPIELEIFKNIFVSISEEMGAVLGRTALSPNIKERKDFSCAVFNPRGETLAQGSHIPVHLGAMPLSVQAAIRPLSVRGRRSRHPQRPLPGRHASSRHHLHRSRFHPTSVWLFSPPTAPTIRTSAE